MTRVVPSFDTRPTTIGIVDRRSDLARSAAAVPEEDDGQRIYSTGLETIDPVDLLLIRHAYLTKATYAELAQRTGMPLDTIKILIRRALSKMRLVGPGARAPS